MSEIGSGSGSSYPGSLDTNNTVEVNSPNAGKTKARAEVPNDLAACIVAIETELGTDPAGSLTNVKTFLQTEHSASGTHTTDSIAEKTAAAGVTVDGCLIKDGITAKTHSLNCDSEATTTHASAATIDMGTVTSGDRIYVEGEVIYELAGTLSNNYIITGYATASKSSGTATITDYWGNSTLKGSYVHLYGNGAYSGSSPINYHYKISGVILVTGTGTLVLQIAISASSSLGASITNTLTSENIAAFLIKKN